nr:pentapeptide repeat-containing protein [Streptomyces sp. SID8379]
MRCTRCRTTAVPSASRDKGGRSCDFSAYPGGVVTHAEREAHAAALRGLLYLACPDALPSAIDETARAITECADQTPLAPVPEAAHLTDPPGDRPVPLDLRWADLSGADLTRANLHGADVHSANLNGANLTHANLRNAKLGYARLIRADLSNATLIRANLRHTILNGANLNGADLSGVKSTRSGEPLERTSVHMRGATLRGSNLSHAELRAADLSGADLSGADLSGANLLRANLDGANLNGANLNDTVMVLANLKGADLTATDLAHLALRSANLTGTRLRRARNMRLPPGATWDERTEWPAELESVVFEQSDEVSPGLYRVRSDPTLDRSDIVPV